jgi:predicted nucleic acid-binding protein
MKTVLCDSSSLISLADNCFLPLLERVGGKFLVSRSVKHETVDRPMITKRFSLPAMRINSYISAGIIQLYDGPGIADYSKKITDLANSLLEYKGKRVKIIHEGEASSIACLKVMGEDTLMIDERTARQLIEAPEFLRDYIGSRTKHRLVINDSVLDELRREIGGITVIRSAELLAYAYDKGYLDDYETDKVLNAGLWALKFAGCSITEDEIKEYTKLLG